MFKATSVIMGRQEQSEGSGHKHYGGGVHVPLFLTHRALV